MANKPILLDDSFSDTPEASASGGAVPLDDSFSIEPDASSEEVIQTDEYARPTQDYKPQENEKEFSFNIDPAVRESMKTAWEEAVGRQLGIDPENQEAMKKLTGILYPVADAGAVALEGLGGLGSAAVAGLTAGVLEDFGVDPVDRYRKAGSATEAFNISSLLFGNAPAEATIARAKNLQAAFDAGASFEDIVKAAPDIDQAALKAAYEAKARGEKVQFTPEIPDIPENINEVAMENDLNTDLLRRNIAEAERPRTKLEEDSATFRERNPEPTPETLWPEKKPLDEKLLEERLLSEVDDFRNRKDSEAPVELTEEFTTKPTPEPDSEILAEVDPHYESVVSKIDEISKDWTNRPDVEVVNRIEDIKNEAVRNKALSDGADLDALGFLGDDGKVRIIASNIKSPDEVPAVMFHESLGHYGLAQKFGADLDNFLGRIYDNGVSGFRDKVNNWLANNPKLYTNLPERRRLLAAVEEVLAEESASGRISPKLVDLLSNLIKKYARQMGFNLKYSEREISTILGMAHDAVVKGKPGAIQNGFKYSRRPKEETPEGVTAVDEAIEALGNYEPKVQSWGDVRTEARLNGVSGRTVNKVGSIKDAAVRLHVTEELAKKTSAEIDRLRDKVEKGDSTLRDRQNLAQRLQDHIDILENLWTQQGDAGRVLNYIRTSEFSRKKIGDLKERVMSQNLKSLVEDEETFNRFLRSLGATSGNPAAVNTAIKALQKPYWEQYVLSLRHNMMLSGAGTHVKNTKDNAMMIAREFEENLLAMPIGLVRKMFGSKDDRVTAAEVGARGYGLIRALADSTTWLETAEAMKGRSLVPYSSKIDMQEARIPVVSKIGDFLHAQDVFFRSFFRNANLYSLGVREAQKKGFKGMSAFQEGSNLALNPTKEMLEESNRMSDISLLVDKPMFAGLEVDKKYKPNMTAKERSAAFASNFLLPFFRVTDRLIAQEIRRSPLSFLDEVTRKDLAAGGQRRDVAIARTLYGSALIYYYWEAAKNGETEGAAPDYKKRQALEATGYLPNSVKEDGKYVDASALNLSFTPGDLHNSIAADTATLYKAYKDGVESDKSAAEKLLTIGQHAMTVLSSKSFAENLTQYTKPFEEGMNEASSDAALGSLIGGMASSFVPALLRQYNQVYGDPVKRDTTGDKTLTGRIAGRVVSGIPELSEELPKKLSVLGDEQTYGRDLSGIGTYQKIDNSPEGKELRRLEETQKEPLLTAPGRKFSINGEEIELVGKDYEDYQRLSGKMFREAMKKVISKPQWRNANDDLKKAVIRELLKESRTEAKMQMFPEKYEGDNEQTEGDEDDD